MDPSAAIGASAPAQAAAQAAPRPAWLSGQTTAARALPYHAAGNGRDSPSRFIFSHATGARAGFPGRFLQATVETRAADHLAPCATVKSMGKDVITARRAPSRALLGYGACALAATMWGTGFYFARIDLDEMSVGYMVLYRFWFASLGLLPLALRYRVRLTWPEMRMLLVCAFL